MRGNARPGNCPDDATAHTLKFAGHARQRTFQRPAMVLRKSGRARDEFASYGDIPSHRPARRSLAASWEFILIAVLFSEKFREEQKRRKHSGGTSLGGRLLLEFAAGSC